MQLTWVLPAQASYQPGALVAADLTVEVDQSGQYYLAGALYTQTLAPIAGTEFGMLQDTQGQSALNSPSYASVFDLVPGQPLELPCALSFDRSDVVLGVALYRMVGSEIDPASDEQMGYMTAVLASPAQPAGGIDLGQIGNAMLAMATLGMLGTVIARQSQK